ncbi:transposon Tf2-6 polyprotein [Trichonephila clavipes]|nr:transposon Tf2-6 polyprotein [Trichonephila clavipes]
MTSETVEVARIALRLPPFWKSNVRLWIAQCDHAFTFSGISSDDTKYSALVANLDAETLSYVSDIVLSPPNSDKYHTLSQRLITQFSHSETQKIKKLLTDLQLGDEKPSHLLRKMKELSNGQLQDDFLQSLWLQRMPPHIQTVLSASSEPLDKLAIIADKVSEVVGSSSTICAATTVPPPSQSSSCSVQPTMDSLARQIQELSLQVAELTRERNSSRHQRYSSDRRRSHSRSRSVNRGSGICYYHRRCKEQARKCVSPCAFVQKRRVSSVIAEMAEPSKHTSRLFLLDRKSGQKFLIDSGRENIVADSLSKIESISEIDYDKIADAQVDNEELNKLRLKPSLNFKQYPLDSGKLLWCDISTTNIRPFIPQPLRMDMFKKIHNLAHPGVKSTVKQIASRFVWLNIRKDVNQWAKSCIQCQKNKINRHSHSQIGTFQEVDDRFSVSFIS